MFDADFFHHITCRSEDVEVVDEVEAVVHEEAEQGGQQEGHNLVFGDAGGEKSDGDEDRAEQEQSEVGAPGGAHIDFAVSGSQLPHRPEVDEGGQQGSTSQARNLAAMSLPSEIGCVNSSSMVPDLRSSANIRIVMAGIRIRKSIGAMSKKFWRVERPVSMTFPRNTQTKRPVSTKNTPTMM